MPTNVADISSTLDNLGNGVLGQFGDVADNTGTTPIVSEDDKACKNTGVTDSGIIKSSRLKSLIAAGVMVYNTLNSLRMAKLQRDLGKKYLELAEEHRKYYNERFKPLEIALTKEALKLPKYVRNKERLNTGQMLVSARGKLAGRIDKAMSCTGRYCTGQRAAIMTDQLLEQAAVESMTAGLASRYTDKEEINHNNLRWDKREQVMKIGRDIPTEATSYANIAAGTFGSLGRQAGQAAEGVMEFLGYGRGTTQYPERRPPMAVAEYKYIPTQLNSFKPEPKEVYVKPEEPEKTIKLSG